VAASRTVAGWSMHKADAVRVGAVCAACALSIASGDIPTRSVAPPVYRLTLEHARHLVAPLRVTLEDLEIRLEQGAAFAAMAEGQPTALVLVGRGEVRFAPPVPSEQRQLQLFSGSSVLTAGIDAAYIRIHPSECSSHVEPLVWSDAPAQGALVKRADAMFREEVARSYVSNRDRLGEVGSLLPFPGDFLAEVRGTGLGPLAFARVASEPEDMMLVERSRSRRVVVYPSADHRATFGFAYGDEYGLPYEVTHYDVDVALDPGEQTMSGQAGLRLRALDALETVRLRLDSKLKVSGVSSPEQGRHEFRQEGGSDALLVRLWPVLPRGGTVNLRVDYTGWTESQPLLGDRPIAGAPSATRRRLELGGPGGTVLFSNRVYWFPQSPVRNPSTAALRVTVPRGYSVAASGVLEATTDTADGSRRSVFTFSTPRPIRYLSVLAGKLARVAATSSETADEPEVVLATPRLVDRAATTRRDVTAIVRYFSSVFGGLPFPRLTLAVVEAPTPSAHSPAHLIVLGVPTSPTGLRSDEGPAVFAEAPEFLLAHEVAHQWWGQGVAWRNYREQWLSEAFAQYSAALYVGHAHGEAAFDRVLEWMGGWALAARERGTIDLGVRAGELANRPQDFAAIVYDRGALVLHLLRRLVGDEAFFRGLESYRQQWSGQRAGTDDFRAAMEKASGRDLQSVFDEWVRRDGVPELLWSASVQSEDATHRLRIALEQSGPVYELPLRLVIDYEDRPSTTHAVHLVERRREVAIDLAGRFKRVRLNGDPGILCVLRERR
jgi:hypothetical protein